MQRFACLLLVITAACGGGTETGQASLTGMQPPAMSASARPFEGADGEGKMRLGWKLEFFQQGPGTDCLSEEATVVASIGIFSNQDAGTKPQAILPIGGISIVLQSPPVVVGTAAATMGAKGVSEIQGQVNITEFHLTPDAMHADRIAGDVNAGGTDTGSGEGVTITGSFTAPICQEN